MPEISNDRIQSKIFEIEEEYKNRIAEVTSDAAERVQRLQGEEPDPNKFEATLKVTFDVKWRITTIKFDIPRFSMERENIKFDIPEVRMKAEEIKFDVPSTRMVRKCVFKKPVFRGLKWYSECVYMDVPEVYKKRVTIKLDIPQFNRKRFEVKFDKPVVSRKRIEIKLHLPQFYVKDISAELKEYERKAEEISGDVNFKMAEIQSEFRVAIESAIGMEIEEIFDETRASLIGSRDAISKDFDVAVSPTKTTIRTLKENNAQDEVARLEGELSRVVSEYELVLNEIDSALREISDQEDGVLRDLRVLS